MVQKTRTFVSDAASWLPKFYRWMSRSRTTFGRDCDTLWNPDCTTRSWAWGYKLSMPCPTCRTPTTTTTWSSKRCWNVHKRTAAKTFVARPPAMSSSTAYVQTVEGVSGVLEHHPIPDESCAWWKWRCSLLSLSEHHQPLHYPPVLHQTEAIPACFRSKRSKWKSSRIM